MFCYLDRGIGIEKLKEFLCLQLIKLGLLFSVVLNLTDEHKEEKCRAFKISNYVLYIGA